ncbi:MAG TPA: class IV adenylate cyclase [Pirellulales bacterium]|jgi:adenylate cyclase class IV
MNANLPTGPRQNVELKARLVDLPGARALAARLSGGPPEIIAQVDTYFACAHGRLKLRTIVGDHSELIAYVRTDEIAPRASRYRIIPVPDAAALGDALSAALGVLVIVEKRREISLYNNVRIHLDQVQGLGTFLEFEAVLEAHQPLAVGELQVRELARQFGLLPEHLVGGSYSDLLLAAPS